MRAHAVAVVLLLPLAACGRIGFDARGAAAGDGAARDGAQGPFAVTVPAPTLLPRTALQLTASVPVTWTVAAGDGAITAAGVYTAPATDGDVAIQAAAIADPTQVVGAALRVTRAIAPAPIAAAASATAPSGMSHQQHVVYDAGTWWLIYETGADAVLRTVSSPDFATWSAGATVTLPVALSADGRDLAVADRVIAGHHVVHVSVGATGFARYHVRAELAGGAIAFGAPRLLNQGGVVRPDGPAVAILPSGQVLDSTGWDSTPATPPLNPCGDGDVEIFTADAVDDGVASFDAVTFTRSVIWCVPQRVNARSLIPDGGTLYALFEDGGSDPDPVNIQMMIRQPAGDWLPDETTFVEPPRVFAADTAFPLDDWTAVALGRQLHALRRTGSPSQAYEHRVLDLDDPAAWTAGGALADEPGVAGDGVVLAPYGTGLLAVALDPQGALDYAFWDGSAWSPWVTLAAPTAARAGLASATGAGVRPAIWWIEGDDLVGAQLP